MSVFDLNKITGNEPPLEVECQECLDKSSRIKELEAVIEKLPDEVSDRLFTSSGPYRYVNRLVLETRQRLDGPGWSKDAVCLHVREAIAAVEKEGAGT